MTEILLEAERLVLRKFTAADLGHLFALDNDPEVMRFINGGTPTSWAVMKDSILPRFLSYDPQHPGFGFWAAEEKSSGSFLGWFSFRPVDEIGEEVVLGYRLKKAAWGQGYATEGARALINKGFTDWGVKRVVATTYEDNLASRRVLEKSGLTLVRRFRLTTEDLLAVDTHHVASLQIWDGDDLEYALEKSAWLRGREAGS